MLLAILSPFPVSTKGQEAEQSTPLCLRIKRDPEAIVSPPKRLHCAGQLPL
jgi:hypothetical protein